MSSMDNLFDEIKRNLAEADQVKKVDNIGIATQKRPHGFFIFIKKLILKSIKWAILPNQNLQTHYNEEILKSAVMIENYLEKNIENIESLRKQILLLEKKANILKTYTDYVMEKLGVNCDLALLQDVNFDYFKFENKMRGSRDVIKKSQEVYVHYFKENGGAVVLDLGCGRGEFLELMYDNGIKAQGTDVYKPFVDYCVRRGFNVECSNALTYLSAFPDTSVGGIFMGQVVEHVGKDYLIALVNMAYNKLKPGCFLILETPNPQSLSTYKDFYSDVSHSTPIHFEYLKELFQQVGFEHIERFENPFAFCDNSLVLLEGEQIDNLKEFNDGIKIANELIFGCRDYTLIARK